MPRRTTGPQDAAATPATPAARRTPVQERSRERMDRILAVAERLIGAGGSEPLTMSEIAADASISIGSLYQYFGDKRAIVRTLAARYAEASRRCLEEALAGATDRPGFVAAFGALVDDYYRIVRNNPVMRDIAAGMRADRELQALEVAESRACGALLAKALRRVAPDADATRARTTAFLVWQLGEDTVRLALAVGRPEGPRLVEAYKRMALRALLQP